MDAVGPRETRPSRLVSFVVDLGNRLAFVALLLLVASLAVVYRGYPKDPNNPLANVLPGAAKNAPLVTLAVAFAIADAVLLTAFLVRWLLRRRGTTALVAYAAVLSVICAAAMVLHHRGQLAAWAQQVRNAVL